MVSERATLERQVLLYKGLVEVSALINGITEQQKLLPEILHVARRVFGAEVSSLFLAHENGELSLAASHGGPSDLRVAPLIVPRGRGISGWVAEHGQPLLVRDAYADERFFRDFDVQTGFRTRSLLCVPLVRGVEKIGVIQVINPHERTCFDEVDLEAFAAYGNLVATALDKVRLLEQQREQERTTQEGLWAREIQASFLPQALPERPDLHFAAAYRPALKVGGDFYDVLQTGTDEVYFVIGDVSGKGVPAALLMAQAVSTLRHLIQPGISPAEALAQWNSSLCGHTVRGMFITALLGRAIISQRRLELASAGHCAPFRLSVRGEEEELRLPGAPPLGILPQLPAQGVSLTLERGEWLACYTDGLPESFSPEDEPLERAGVASLLRARFPSAGAVVDALTLGERRHRRYAEPHDDLTLLVLGF